MQFNEKTKGFTALVDWGTSNFRLFLLSPGGEVTANASTGRGVMHMGGEGFENYLLEKLAGLGEGEQISSVLMCGMVGSNMGWQEAGYLDCPADPGDVSDRLVRARSNRLDALIVPGLKCISLLGEPDVLRGEETQVIGWFDSARAGQREESLLCLPGTHTKWVRVSAGRVVNFHTGFSGELFEHLCRNSTLVEGEQQDDSDAFAQGSRLGLRSATLSQTLFTARSRVLDGVMPATAARSYLSGLLIASDVRSAVDLCSPVSQVTVIGDPDISQLYAKALRCLGVDCQVSVGAELMVSGLKAIARSSGYRARS